MSGIISPELGEMFEKMKGYSNLEMKEYSSMNLKKNNTPDERKMEKMDGNEMSSMAEYIEEQFIKESY